MLYSTLHISLSTRIFYNSSINPWCSQYRFVHHFNIFKRRGFTSKDSFFPALDEIFPAPIPRPSLSPKQHPLSKRIDPFYYFRNDHASLDQFLKIENSKVDMCIEQNKEQLKYISSVRISRNSLSASKTLHSFLQESPDNQGIIPEAIGAFQYWTIPSSNGPAYCRLPISSPWHPVPPFLSPEKLLSGQQIKKIAISPSHGFFAYIIEESGDEYGRLYIQSFADHEHRYVKDDRIFNVVFLTDHLIAYTICNEQLRPDKIFLASLSRQHGIASKCIYSCEQGFLDISITKDGKFLTINSNTLTSSEVQLLDVSKPSSPLIQIQPRRPHVQYYIDHHKDRFYMLTNDDGHKNFKLVTFPSTSSNHELNHELRTDLYVPEVDTKIEDIDLFKDHLVLYLRQQARCLIEIIQLKTGQKHTVSLGIGVSVSPASNMDYHAKSVRMHLRDPYSKGETLEFHFDSLRLVSLHSPSIPPNIFNKLDFTTERIWVPSRDKDASIPVTLLYKKNAHFNGRHSLLIHVYGAYGLPLDPTFNESTLKLLNNDWIIAYAHVRGGSELGFRWHENGKLLSKMNSVHDLLDVSTYLKKHKYFHPRKLAGSAVSAGALSLATAALIEPSLFRGVILKSPFLDLVSTMIDPTLPLTETEYLEWGNPKDPAVFEFMTAVSPYERLLTAKSFIPAMFVTASRQDQRTPIWQCAKFMALCRQDLRAHILFKTYDEGGHLTRCSTMDALEILFLLQMR